MKTLLHLTALCVLTLLVATPAFSAGSWAPGADGTLIARLRLKNISIGSINDITDSYASCGSMTVTPRSVTSGAFSIYGLSTAANAAVTQKSDVEAGILLGTFNSSDNNLPITFNPSSDHIRIVEDTPDYYWQALVDMVCDFTEGFGGVETKTISFYTSDATAFTGPMCERIHAASTVVAATAWTGTSSALVNFQKRPTPLGAVTTLTDPVITASSSGVDGTVKSDGSEAVAQGQYLCFDPGTVNTGVVGGTVTYQVD